eukprot:2897949-Rhodomonas_salina.1
MIAPCSTSTFLNIDLFSRQTPLYTRIANHFQGEVIVFPPSMSHESRLLPGLTSINVWLLVPRFAAAAARTSQEDAEHISQGDEQGKKEDTTGPLRRQTRQHETAPSQIFRHPDVSEKHRQKRTVPDDTASAVESIRRRVRSPVGVCVLMSRDCSARMLPAAMPAPVTANISMSGHRSL